MFGNVYMGRRVFVTGHTGFKGSWLTAWLLSLGAEVMGYSLDGSVGVPTEPSHFSVLMQDARFHTSPSEGGQFHDVRGDIRQVDTLCTVMREFAPDIVFHMAAQALVPLSYEQPLATFTSNALGTVHVLEAVRRAPSVRALVCITSDKCYENNEWLWGYRESDALGGHDPYSASKACAEIMAHAYFRSYFKDTPKDRPKDTSKDAPACATVRAGNVIGGGDWAPDRIIPDCVRAWVQGEAVSLRSPHATRPWQHVLEPLSGYLCLGAKLFMQDEKRSLYDGEAYNFGPSPHVVQTVLEVVEALSLQWKGFRYHHDRSAPRALHECTLLKLCCDKALSHLQWRAVLDFEESIRYTAEWYRAYYGNEGKKGQHMAALTFGQIAAYTNMAEQREIAWALPHST